MEPKTNNDGKNVNGRKRRLTAVALKYKMHEDAAPRVVAKGKGKIAERIIDLAKEHDIPIKEDPDLVEVLSKLELNENIPPELYKVIAEILAFVYKMSSKRKEESASDNRG